MLKTHPAEARNTRRVTIEGENRAGTRRVAVIGGGASGLLTAWLIQQAHDVVVYEAESRLGGHAQTVPVDDDGEIVHAEAGFKYFFDRGNPHVLGVFDELGLDVAWIDETIALTHPDVDGELVLPTRSPRQLARVLSAPGALRDLACLSALRLAYDEVVAGKDQRTTVDELLSWRRFPAASRSFLRDFISSCWGAPTHVMADFPAYNVLRLLSSPGARFRRTGYLAGGTSRYIAALSSRLHRCRIRKADPVAVVERSSRGWQVIASDRQRYDAVVFALPPWRAASILHGAPRWRDALASFRRFHAHVAVHRDSGLMPSDRRDWSLTNASKRRGRTLLTSWEGMQARRDVFRSWTLPDERPRGTVYTATYEHLVVDVASAARRANVEALQGQGGLHAVGLYLGDIDCHESCVTSALDVSRRLAPRSGAAARLRERVRVRQGHDSAAVSRWPQWLSRDRPGPPPRMTRCSADAEVALRRS